MTLDCRISLQSRHRINSEWICHSGASPRPQVPVLGDHAAGILFSLAPQDLEAYPIKQDHPFVDLREAALEVQLVNYYIMNIRNQGKKEAIPFSFCQSNDRASITRDS